MVSMTALVRLACQVLLACLALPALAADPAPTRTLHFPLTVDHVQARQVRHALELAYASLNIKVQFSARPALRAIVEADAGQLDGEVIRPIQIEDSYPNLRRVDVPLYMNGASAWVRKETGAAPATVEALSKFKRVGVVRGIRHAEESTKGWANVVLSNSYPAGVRMLQHGMIDVLLGGDGPIRDAIAASGVEASQFNGADIYSTPLYHYLHKRHADLLPLVQRELSKLKGQTGTVLDGLLASGRTGIPR